MPAVLGCGKVIMVSNHIANDIELFFNWGAASALGGVLLLALALPTLIVILMSFSDSQYLEFPPREWSLRWDRNYLGSSSWMQATATSFQAGALHTLMLTPIIVPVIRVWAPFLVPNASQTMDRGREDDFTK